MGTGTASMDDLSKLSDRQLKKLLPRGFDFSKDQRLSRSLRRMRWINYIRRHGFSQISVQASPIATPSKKKRLPKNYYFDNDLVESLLKRYKATACTDVALRDEIMHHAEELIRQIIRAHGLHNIYVGHEESSFDDLFQVGWAQIESTLYKYEPGKAKVFNLWSQVARTVILAHIKKDGRDRRNSGGYKDFVVKKGISRTIMLQRFVEEAREICKWNKQHLKLLDVLTEIYDEDPRPYEGLLGKLIEKSQLPKTVVLDFLATLRMRSHEFTDAPVNHRPLPHPLSFEGSDDDEY